MGSTAADAIEQGALDFDAERRGGRTRWILGVDEVGRGCLAGPVVAAAVVLAPELPIAGIRDSKKLDAPRRERVATEIRVRAFTWAFAFVGPGRIDALNIRRASLLAMRRAVVRAARIARLRAPESSDAAAWRVLVDGSDRIPGVEFEQESVVAGDARSAAIGAASILAKVVRDDLMQRLGGEHPDYGFARNKGYGTPEHLEALDRLGPCRWHRHSFAPIAQPSLWAGLVP